VLYGTALGALINDTGGTPLSDVKAVRVGGPAGLLLGADALDTAMLDAAFNENHGFGPLLLEVIPAGACAVETARDALRLLHAASCGKCVFCREGTLHLLSILEDIAGGEGRLEDLEQLAALGHQMRTGCVCDLGRWASEPVLGALALFPEDFRNHILQKKCSTASKGGDGHA
jgi:NADH:ubiquinone oxidoreductase subunit F (NADH-binding)